MPNKEFNNMQACFKCWEIPYLANRHLNKLFYVAIMSSEPLFAPEPVAHSSVGLGE